MRAGKTREHERKSVIGIYCCCTDNCHLRGRQLLLHCWKLQVQLFCGCVSTNEMYETSPYRVVEFSIFHLCHVGHFNCGRLVYIVIRCSRHVCIQTGCIGIFFGVFGERRKEPSQRTQTINFRPTAIFGVLRNGAACSFRFETNVERLSARLRHFDHGIKAQLRTRTFWYRSKCLSKTIFWWTLRSSPFCSAVQIDFLFVIWNMGWFREEIMGKNWVMFRKLVSLSICEHILLHFDESQSGDYIFITTTTILTW